MDYKRNNRYFKDTGKYLIIALAGIAIIALGAILWIFAWELWRLGTPMMVIGLVIAIFGFSMRVRDTDIDFDCEDKIREQVDTLIKRHEISANAQRYHKPMSYKGYQYGDNETGPQLKKGSDEIIRSTIYAGGSIVFSLKKIYFVKRTFSLVDAVDDEVYGECAYTDITDVTITEKSRRYTRKDKFDDIYYVVLSINTEEGSVFNIEVKGDAEVEGFVSDVNRIIKQRKDEAASQA